MSIEDVSNDAIEDLSEFQGDEGLARRWLKEINTVIHSKAQVDFEKTGKRIVRDYRNSGSLDVALSNEVTSRVMLNVVWSNTQILKPTLYSRMPKVVVERRFKDSDPIGRLAAQSCERATSFMLSSQQDKFNYSVRSAVEDRLLAGRGTVWPRYDCDWIEKNDENGLPITDETGEPVRVPKPNTEKVYVDFVNWLDYLSSPSRNPYEDRWRAKRAYMTRAELIKRFGKEKGKACKLNHSPYEKESGKNEEDVEFLKQAEVWEIEDSESKMRIWVSEGYKEAPLDVKPDAFKLNGFFVTPAPLLATTTTDSSYPTPDVKIYERLADELDKCTKRLSAMVECVRLVGAVAAQYNADIKNMLNMKDGQLWPIEAWTVLKEKGGFQGVIDWLPFEQCVAAIPVLMQQQQNLLDQVNMISGVPEVAQGYSDPNQTAEAVQRTSQWIIVKVADKQADVQRFCRDVISKVAEIIFEPGLFSDETIALMCGVAQMPPEDQQMFPQALQLLREDRLRTFRVDIETDSTIAIDENQERSSRMEAFQTLTQMLSGIQNAMQFRPEIVQPMIETALFVMRSFRAARPVEGAWERAMEQIEQNDAQAAEQAANQPPPPDYEAMKLQNEQQHLQIQSQQAANETQKIQNEMMGAGAEAQFKQYIEQQKLQNDQQKTMMDYELGSQKLQMDFELGSQKLQIDAAQVGNEKEMVQLEQSLEAFKIKFDAAAETQRLKFEEMAGMLKIKESFLEEARLKQEQTDHKVKELESKGGDRSGGSGGAAIHLNVIGNEKPRKKTSKLTKTPEGHYLYESVEHSDPGAIDGPGVTVESPSVVQSKKITKGKDGSLSIEHL